MSESFWEQLRTKLKDKGLPPEKIKKFEELVEQEGLTQLIERVVSEIEELNKLIDVVSIVKGLRSELHEHRHKAKSFMEYLIEEQVKLAEEKAPDKKIREVSLLLKGMLDELAESRHRLLMRLKDLLLSELDSSEGQDELLKEVEELESIQDVNRIKELIRKFPLLIERKDEGIKQVDLRKIFAEGRIARELGPYIITENTLDELLALMVKVEDLKRELDERGIDYVKLSRFSSIEVNLALMIAESIGKKTYLKIYSPFKYMRNLLEEGTALRRLADDLAKASTELEEIKDELHRKLVERRLDEIADLVKLIGVNLIRPAVVFNPRDIEVLKNEVLRIKRLPDLLKNLMTELDNLPRGLRVPLYGVTFETEEKLIESLIHAFRVARLSEGLEVSIQSPAEITDRVLELYPEWRSRTIRALMEKGILSIDELDFVPEIWRRWFLSNLEEEGIAVIVDNSIVLKAPISELFKRVEMKIEMLKDELEYLGDYVADIGLDPELIRLFEEEFKRAEELSSEGMINEALTLLKELDSKLSDALSKRYVTKKS